MKTKNYEESAEYMNKILIELEIPTLYEPHELGKEPFFLAKEEDMSKLDEMVAELVNSYIDTFLDELETWRECFTTDNIKLLKRIIENN